MALYLYMAIIEEVKRNKKSYTIVVDGCTLKGCNVEVCYKHGIKVGEMPNDKYRAFLAENEKVNAKTYLYSMIARKARTEKEAKLKLKEKGYSHEAISYAIAKAQEYGFLSDEDFAKNYVEISSRNKGSYRLKQELKQKGVSDELISEALIEIDEDAERKQAEELAMRFLKGKAIDDKTREKLFRYLVSRGYGYDIIKGILRKIGAEID